MDNTERFQSLFSNAKSNQDYVAILEDHKNDADFSDLSLWFFNTVADSITLNYYNYDLAVLTNDPKVDLLHRTIKYAPENKPFFFALDHFFQGKNKKCLEYVKKCLDQDRQESQSKHLTIADFTYVYVVPFKSAFPGFWDNVSKELESINTQKGVMELCRAVPTIYGSRDLNEIISCLLDIQDIADNEPSIDALLGYEYLVDKKYENALAYFERLKPEENTSLYFFADDIYYFMGICYDHLRDSKNEIASYEKSYNLYPEGLGVLNSLGYAYYKAKQYNKALETFRKCLDENNDAKYAANNYVRTLLAMKRYKDAKDFVKHSSYKIAKSILDRVRKAENTNKRVSKDPEISADTEQQANVADDVATDEKAITLGVEKEQFSAEHVLEDEVFSRIKAGKILFGKKLKIYKRPGEFGRQYPLKGFGRLDLLAEDDKGELYIIELKKDSGYDDVYKQITDYLEWFSKNWKEKVPVHGIICLNNPSQKLIEQVHQDPRIRLYEYAISFDEK
ncbi:MAG: endonuclease NucS domain-containing protein [Bilifractor sp.]|jgi:tetratricopeptide (TPR) repeat protein